MEAYDRRKRDVRRSTGVGLVATVLFLILLVEAVTTRQWFFVGVFVLCLVVVAVFNVATYQLYKRHVQGR